MAAHDRLLAPIAVPGGAGRHRILKNEWQRCRGTLWVFWTQILCSSCPNTSAGALLKPLPFEEPERLVGVWHRGFGFSEGLNHREENRVVEDFGMWDDDFVTVTGLEEPERVDAM